MYFFHYRDTQDVNEQLLQTIRYLIHLKHSLLFSFKYRDNDASRWVKFCDKIDVKLNENIICIYMKQFISLTKINL